MNQEAKKQVLRSLVYGVYVLGVRDDDASNGAHVTTVSWVTQLSFEPPMLGVALHRESRALLLVSRAKAFSLCVLPASAKAIASKLGRASADVSDKGTSVALHKGASGDATAPPVVQAATGWLECAVDHEIEAGDHVLVTARVHDATVVGGEATLTLAETGWRYSG
jgi:flavin reductase (DIM6/NTAB) family NADH-FMN oxidoreductase RutF